MRNWAANIVIDGAPLGSQGLSDQYDRMVGELLDSIKTNAVGAIVLQAIGESPGNLVIKPRTYRPAVPREGYQASTLPKVSEADYDAGRKFDTFAGGVSNNKGADILIKYSPSDWFDPLNDGAKVAGGHYAPDDVLVHEMVHAMRGLRGLWRKDAMLHFENWEDFFAITITNMFLSTAKRPNDLRGSHQPQWEFVNASGVTTPLGFYLYYITQFLDLKAKMPKLYDQLWKAKATWNPIRDGEAYNEKVQSGVFN